jgi:predicted porin
MKKSLFAIAAVGALAGAAQAQSSVTVYGIVDAGYATVSNTTAAGGSTTGVQSGGMASPRLGLRGTEATGGGNNVGFVLEAELLTANGSANGIAGGTAVGAQSFSTSQFFNRASYVSMSNAQFGEVRIGLSNTATYDNQIKFDPLKAANLGGYLNASTTVTTATTGAAGTQTQGASRANNAISYISPTFMGLQARVITGEAQSATGMNLVSGNVAYARVTDYGLSYNFKALDLAATYRTVNGTGGAAASSTTGAYGSYDLKMVKPYLLYNISANKTPGVAQGMNFISKMAGIEVPITPVVKVAAQYTANVNGNANTGSLSANNSAVGVMGTYSMSKRTTLYAIGAFSQNGGAGASITSSTKFTGVTAPIKATGSSSYQDQQGYMIGINHTF